MRIPAFLGVLACSIAFLPASAQSLKPGLWEINNRMNNPQMDQQMAEMQKQMAAMPPDQRKQMDAMLAQQGVRMAPGAKGMVLQTCMTQEMVERNDMPMQDGCKMTSQQRSGNTMKMAFSCPNPPTTGEGQITFTSAEAYTSKMTIKSKVQGKTETTAMDSAGKWLKADCGKLQPKK